jgi:hypothetical protein
MLLLYSLDCPFLSKAKTADVELLIYPNRLNLPAVFVIEGSIVSL